MATQIIATIFAVFGILMSPIGWGWALAVWGYALVWFLVNGQVKLAAYRIFDPAEGPLLTRKDSAYQARIQKRALEIYTRGGRQEGRALQDWLRAEREVHEEKHEKDGMGKTG